CDQLFSRIKTGVDCQSGLRCIADGVASEDSLAKCAFRWVQSTEVKLSASSTYFETDLRRRKLKTLRSGFTEVEFQQFANGPRRAKVMQPGLQLKQRIRQSLRLDRGQFLKCDWDSADSNGYLADVPFEFCKLPDIGRPHGGGRMVKKIGKPGAELRDTWSLR